MCKSIDSKLDKLTSKVDELEIKIETIHNKIINAPLDKIEEKSSKSNSNVSIRTKKKKKISISSPSKINIPDTEKNGSITFEMYKDKSIITGDTYNKKKFIKNYKGQWSPDHKGWIIYNTQNIKELKSILKKTSTQFSLKKYDYNLDNVDNSNTSNTSNTSNNMSEHTIPQEYAFITDE